MTKAKKPGHDKPRSGEEGREIPGQGVGLFSTGGLILSHNVHRGRMMMKTNPLI